MSGMDSAFILTPPPARHPPDPHLTPLPEPGTDTWTSSLPSRRLRAGSDAPASVMRPPGTADRPLPRASLPTATPRRAGRGWVPRGGPSPPPGAGHLLPHTGQPVPKSPGPQRGAQPRPLAPLQSPRGHPKPVACP